MKRGKLIVFEGISGTGKETQAKLLQAYLVRKNIVARIVYHPSPELKDILKLWRKNRNIDHVSEAYFLLADRYNRVKEVIAPAIKRGEWVISLRNWLSALVYQAKTVKDREYLEKEFARFEPPADLLYYFDIDPSVAIARIRKRHSATGELIGKFETIQQLKEKRKRYRDVLRKIPHYVIDASDTKENIHRVISEHICEL